MSRSPQDVYARYLLSSRGYPLWIPEPSHHVLLHRPDGLRIGDVGVIVPEDGGFEVFFNICSPREHPFHRATGVPDDFEHVPLRDEDIRIIPNVEAPARVISTSSVTNIRKVELPSRGTSSAQVGGLGYEFAFSSSAGALLILPEGAARHELRNRRLFFDQATRHGISWYRFAEEHLGRMISHDSLYLITGFYKTRSWSLAAFENAAGSGEFSAQFKMAQVGGSDIAGSYTWETTRSLDWRVGPVENYGIPNQSVFIRGFKIALRADLLGKTRADVSVGVPDTHLEHETFPHATKRGSWMSRVWRGLSRGSRPGTDMQDQVATSSFIDEAGNDPPRNVGRRVVVQPMPELSQIFHPSDIINQYLLEKETGADIAITHDGDWAAILRKARFKPEDFMQALQGISLLGDSIISCHFHVVSEGGAVSLRAKSDTDENDTMMHPTTIDVHEAICEQQAPLVQDTSFKGWISTEHASNVPITDRGQDRKVAVDKPPWEQEIENEKFDPQLDVQGLPPPYEFPNYVKFMDAEEKSHLLPDSICVNPNVAQPLDTHWLLLPYNPRTSKHLLRFDIILPVDKICYQYSNNVRERLAEEDLEAPASTEPITKMTITFEQRPFNWIINVENPSGICCRHVFEAIYNSFQQQLTLGELWRVPDRHACEEAFRLRTVVIGNSRVEQALGWKRVDVLLHHTIFHGLTTDPEQGMGIWVLHLGAPLPNISNPIGPPRSPSLTITSRNSSSTEEQSTDRSDECHLTPSLTTSPKAGSTTTSIRNSVPSYSGSDPTRAAATYGFHIAASPFVQPRQRIERPRPIHRPLGPRQRPNHMSGRLYPLH